MMTTPARRSNSFSNGLTNRDGVTGPLAGQVPEWAAGLHDPRMR